MIDDEIKKNLQRCARCGLCVQNCPIYDITKNENNTARGLICKLSGYFEKKLSEKEIKKDLKICLNCSKCKLNCPSKVDTTSIFAYKNASLYPSKISQKLFMTLKLLPVKIFYFFNFLKASQKKAQNNNIFYFKGCMAHSQHKNTYLDFLFYNPPFLCCGLPYLSGGDIKNYEKVKKENIELIKKSKQVIVDCASCKSTLLNYDSLSYEDKKKIIFFSELLKNKKYKIKKNSKYKNKTIIFHKPCHLSKEDFETIENFLNSIEGLNYKKSENPELCCGFGGSYFLFHPLVSSKIILKKAEDIKKNKPDLILTSCPSCTLGLRFGQIISFNFKKTLELRDFINNELVEYN